MFEPSFPKRRVPPNMDGFAVSRNMPTDWETTYSADSKPKAITSDIYGRSEVDTAALQSTHFKMGNDYDPTITETQDAYRAYKIDNREPIRTRDQLMKSSFVLGDGTKMETRESLTKQKSIPFDPNLPRPTMRSELVGSHIDLGAGNQEKWETTAQAAFKPFQFAKPSVINRNLQSSDGTKEALAANTAFNSYVTENQANFVNFKYSPNPIDKQERLTRYRSSQVQLGDPTANYFQTTNQSDFKHFIIPPADRSVAKATRERLTKSQFYGDRRESMNVTSSHNDTFKEYKGFKPPKPAETNLSVSHHNFRDCNETFQSESHDSYVPHKIEVTPKVDLHLTNTHIAFGQPGYSEMKSLYRDTFTEKQNVSEPVDRAAARYFNTAHHSRVVDETDHSPMMTTSQATYVPFTGVRPRSPAQHLQSCNSVTPADPSLTVKESTMHASFVHHKNFVADKPINNSLQRSHINMSGGEPVDQWKTTQSDYFQFKTYKFD